MNQLKPPLPFQTTTDIAQRVHGYVVSPRDLVAPVVFGANIENPTILDVDDRKGVIIGFGGPQLKCVLSAPSIELLR